MGDGALMYKLLTWQVICRGTWYIVRSVYVLPYLLDRFSTRTLINISLFKQRELKKINEVRFCRRLGRAADPGFPGTAQSPPRKREQEHRLLFSGDRATAWLQRTQESPALLQCPSSRSSLTAAAVTFQSSGAGLPGPPSPSSQKKLEEGKCKELMLSPLL